MANDFSQRLIAWQRQHGRHHLPWQVRDPYCIWLSEIMLQQTQVATVLDYYPRFLARFPNVQQLAQASQDEVLQLWAGLGYYSRARNLHTAAQQIVQDFGGQFPQTRQELEQLKGVGRSTAAAISAFAFHQRETILDGNVKRVICRVFALSGSLKERAFEQHLWQFAQNLLPEKPKDMPTYIQGLMDLGATICKRSKPLCNACPMNDICQAKAQNLIDELPRKNAPTPIKTLTLFWAIIRRKDGAIFVHKRPQKGIWAGLYCVPCFEQLSELNQFCQTHQLPENGEEQAPFTHRLTHRLLEIIAFEYRVAQDFRLPESEWIMYHHQQSPLGLPKPLQQYLSQTNPAKKAK